LIVICFAIYGYLENYRYKITRYLVNNKKIPIELHNKKIVIISDFHNSNQLKINSLLRSINEEKPDFIIISGDLVNGGGPISNAKELILNLNNDYKIFYTPGNHENERDEISPGSINELINVTTYLSNKNSIFFNSKIYGLNIDKEFYNRFKQPPMTLEYITEKLGITSKNCYNILVAHTPAYIKEYSKWGADLIICGHYHGGFVRIPFVAGLISPQLKIFPKYSGGHYKVNESDAIVSRGLGSHTLPFRIFNTPELIVVKFSKEER
jgi:predicted MPP superfamily phosphohydrolase